MRLFTSLLALVTIIGVATPAHADFTASMTGRTFNNPVSSYIDNVLASRIGSRSSGGRSRARANVHHEPIAGTDFRSTERRIAIEPIVNQLATTDAERTAVRQGIERIFVGFEKDQRKNNVSHALMFAVSMAYFVDRGKQIDEDDYTDGIAAINDKLVATPAFLQMSDLDRQKTYETLVALGAVTGILYNAGKRDFNMATVAKQLASGLLQQLGIQ